jgi:hypothetical protein
MQVRAIGPAARLGSGEALRPPRLERAIGVIYRPETELQRHYFQAVPGVARTGGRGSCPCRAG